MAWAMFWQLIVAKASEDGLEFFRTLPHVSHFHHSMTTCHCQSSGNQDDRFTHSLWVAQPEEEKPKDDEEKDEEKEEKDNAAGWDVLEVT